VFSKNNNARTTAKETEWPGEEKRNSCIYLEQLKKVDGNEGTSRLFHSTPGFSDVSSPVFLLVSSLGFPAVCPQLSPGKQ